MSGKEEQVKPLAPAFYRLDKDESSAALPTEFMGRGHKRCIKWGGCCFAILSIVVVVLFVLMITVFHVKDPILNIKYANSIRGLKRAADSDRELNFTIESHLSIKNPNAASFKFSNMTVYVYCDGSVIGETQTLSGEVRARRTLRMSLAIELRGLKCADSSTRMLPISSYTWISGKVRIGGGIKRALVVRMNCTMNVNVSSQIIQDQNCRRGVSL